MYKNKYYKYKSKYQNLKDNKRTLFYENKFDNDPDMVYYEDEEIIAKPESELPSWAVTDEDDDKRAEEIFTDGKGKFIGFNEMILDDLQQVTYDIGVTAPVRGRLFDRSDFVKDDFIGFADKPSKSKILLINDNESFDDLTDKYAMLDGEDPDYVYINWPDLREKYRGIYILSSSLGDRKEDIPYKDRTVYNWVNEDFFFPDKVILFVKYRELINFREIDKPFKAKILDPFAIEETDFARLADPITYDKILLIDDVKSFDKFTNKYGFLNKNKEIILINWNKVNSEYDGVYIDKDNDFKELRYEIAFFQTQQYQSWWKYYDFSDEVVYVFQI